MHLKLCVNVCVLINYLRCICLVVYCEHCNLQDCYRKPKMKLQIELNQTATGAWQKIASMPEFAMSTKAGIVYALMHRYLNPPPNGVSKPSAPTTPDIGKVELRHQQEADQLIAERAAREEAKLAAFRSSGVWPKPAGSHNGVMYWAMPKLFGISGGEDSGPVYTFNQSMPWTPPSDYPGPSHPGAAPIEDDPMPELERFDSEDAWREALDAWKARGNI